MRVFIYPEGPEVPLQGFDECTQTESIFRKEINKLNIVDKIEDADIAFIPCFTASVYYSLGQDQEQFMYYMAEHYLSRLCTNREIRKTVPHFLVYSYVLVDVSFDFIPSDIKILAYESEVTDLSKTELKDNGCGDRIIVIPYILETQPWFTNKVKRITKFSLEGMGEQRKLSDFHQRNALTFVGDMKSARSLQIKRRSEFVRLLASRFRCIDICDPKRTEIHTQYNRAKLGLVLRGDTPTRKAFYTAISQSCVPVIHENELIHYGELFGGMLPIEDIVVAIPRIDSKEDVNVAIDIIEQTLNNQEALDKKMLLLESVFSELNYFSEKHGISAPVYNALMAVIGKAERAHKKTHPLIYIYDVPEEFTDSMLPVNISPTEVLDTISADNSGFGKRIGNYYQTSQYALEIIWNKRMRKYPRVTSCIKKADLAFIPCYTFLSAWKQLEYYYSCSDVVETISSIISMFPQIIENQHLPHLMVYSDVLWQDERVYNHHIKLPQNVTMLALESAPNNHLGNRTMTVPYATEVHMNFISHHNAFIYETFWNDTREYVLSYIGRPRYPLDDIGISTDFIVDQLTADLDQDPKYWKSANIESVFNKVRAIYSNSKFSLQPHGDMGTRRGFYQSLLFGSIPVIFENNKAAYGSLFGGIIPIEEVSIIIPDNQIKDTLSILRNIPEEKIRSIKNKIYSRLSSFQYSAFNDPSDAFSTVIRSYIA